MAVSPPLDRRQLEQLLQEFYQRVPFYTPEWKPGTELGLDSALIRIFSLMMSDTIDRLNQSPNKHFIAFLNMLGVKLLPALQARVPVTFYLSTGTPLRVIIPQKTQIAANSPMGGEPIPFETEKLILATPAKLVDAYSVNPAKDQVFRVPPGFLADTAIGPFVADLSFAAQPGDKTLFLDTKADLQSGDLIRVGNDAENIGSSDSSGDRSSNQADYVEVKKATENKVELNQSLTNLHPSGQPVSKVRVFELFEGLNQQAHILYLGHSHLFQIKDQVTIQLVFSTWDSAWVNSLRWEYYGTKQGSQEQDWYAFDQADHPNHDATLTLTKRNLDELKALELHGIKSNWIRGVVKPNQLIKSTDIPIDTVKAMTIDTVNAIVKPLSEDGDNPGGTLPDFAFYNDIPLDATQTFYPLGQKPRLFDTVYIASQEAFSKPGFEIELNITVEGSLPTTRTPVAQVQGVGPRFRTRLATAGITTVDQLLEQTPEQLTAILETTTIRAGNILDAARREFYDRARADNPQGMRPENTPVLSWEYWNGKGWVKLPLEPSSVSENFLEPAQRSIRFPCPGDMGETAVSGQQNYWIRVRLISGDYGREEFEVNPNDNGKIISKSNFYPPKISQFKINYYPPAAQAQGFPLESCLTLNQLTFQDRTAESRTKGKAFQPFQKLEDAHQTLYLGFDAPPMKGPISLFISLEIQDYTERNRPRVQWEYFRQQEGQGEWSPLNVVDGTSHLTQSGTIEFVGLPDFALTTYFGKTLYWIRVIDVQDRFKPLERAIAEQLNPKPTEAAIPEQISCFTGLQPCTQPLLLINSPFLAAQLRNIAPAPRIKGLYLNTTWASQAESFNEQILGSSDGTKNQTFSFFKFPVIGEDRRTQNQKRGANDQFGESDLGDTIDKHTANAVIDFAKKHQSGCIVLPDMNDYRRRKQAEIAAFAERECGGWKGIEKKFAKAQNEKIHSWSYGQLIRYISNQAEKEGIVVRIGRQPIHGSSQEQGKQMALESYKERKKSKKSLSKKSAEE
ncbi:MAG TPA: helix-hairpin-helix domain-containing protein [Microcoleaceae cyanobacterium]|jgi:hypothetical protein